MTKLKSIIFGVGMLLGTASIAATLGEDGLHKADWQHQTFMDMREDHEAAKAEGKTLLIMWEQQGCIYCTKMHEDVFPIEDINAMLNDEFYVVQYNLFGDLEVTDFDGEVLPEKDMALKWRVMFTPNLMFFPDEIPEGVTAVEAAAVNMPGAFGQWTMRNLMTWVREKGYEGEENFQKYHARKINEAREAGIDLGGE